MKHPLVSILIPFKNAVPYAAECLQSILVQEYTNWEVLAVDDHSADGSLALFKAFAARDKRIRVFRNRGTGIIPALRTAFGHRRGALVTRMDSDDIMTPDKIGVLATSLVHTGRGHVALGLVSYFSENGISDGYARYEKWLNHLTSGGRNYAEIYKECVIPSPCWMLFREDLEACGGFDQDRYPEDYDLAFRLFEQGYRCIPCEKTLHRWRDHANRTSRNSEHYTQNYFLDIKLHYFLRLDHSPARPLTLWGAGSKGKTIAKKLLELEIPFHWLCDNPNKIGKWIYGLEMCHFSFLETLIDPQSIITVANEKAQQKIRDYLAGMGQSAMHDYFFFC